MLAVFGIRQTKGRTSHTVRYAVIAQGEPAAQFQIAHNGDGRFRLVGEIDISTYEELIEVVMPAVHQDGGDVILDLSGLEFIDSSGISALIQVAKHLESHRKLVLSSPRHEVARVLDLVGIHRMAQLSIQDGHGP